MMWKIYPALVIFGVSLGLLVLANFGARAQALELTVTTDTNMFGSGEPVLVEITLKNVSDGSVVLPDIDSSIQDTYIQVEIVHVESGTPIFFLNLLENMGKAGAGTPAHSTQVLGPGKELVFPNILNVNGLGFLGFVNPEDPGSVRTFGGEFSLVAIFSVNEENEPLGGDAAFFKGTVVSTDLGPPTIIIVDRLVHIDIRPNKEPNPVNLRGRDAISVAVLTTDIFDATTVDPLTVEFGPSGALESHGRGHIKDMDSDGDFDLVLHFDTRDTGIACGDTSASLTGETFDGQAIEGSDSIKTVPCR